MQKYVIVNADDFGYSTGVNRGIVECHERGVVTSAGLMVNTPAAEEAVRQAAARPGLSLGLHVNFTNEAQRLVEFDDPLICRAELRRQFDLFVQMVGRKPTHIDSHQHVHRARGRLPFFLELAQEHGIPLRDQPPVVYKGGFYAQWEYGVTDPSKVSVEALSRMLRNELTRGIYEFGTHPGYRCPEASFVYDAERELEVATLCDPAIPRLMDELGIELISYHGLPEAVARLAEA